MNLSRDGEPIVVNLAPKRQFFTGKTFDGVRGALAQGETESVERVVGELHLEELQHRIQGVV